MLQHFTDPRFLGKAGKRSNALFEELFHSYSALYPIARPEINKYINNKRPVVQTIPDFYNETGLDCLAKDIKEHVFPKLVSVRAFTDQLYRTIQSDPDLRNLLKYNGTRNYPQEDGFELALYVAEVLFTIIRRRHYPPAKNGELELPQWLASQLDHYLISKKVPDPCSFFAGREDEIRKLHDLLKQKHNVFLWGLPGIGKSELVYQYCQAYGHTYNNILYVNSTGNLKDDLCTLRIIGGMTLTGDMFWDVLHCLRHLHEDTLLIIDNWNTIDYHGNDFANVMECGCKLLVTTQCKVQDPDNMGHLELEEIDDMDTLIELVKTISKRTKLRKNTLQKIITILHHHTTAVVLLALLLRKRRYTAGDILRALNLRNLKDFFAEKLFFSNKMDTYCEHLRTLFQLFRFKDMERYALQNMILIPGSGIPLYLFEQWAELEDPDVMDGMIDGGVIHATDSGDNGECYYMVSLKPIIRELASEEMPPSIQKCHTLIHNTADAMGILMDSETDPYLLQLSQEVIEWAEKDDIPMYIDYLHKSFELAARHDHSVAMQMIADALAKVLTETPYGTNSDKALMQDYQAAVQNTPAEAIAYRKAALLLLDLGIPKEKQLAAEILDRIAGDYFDDGNWTMAKQYSDTSWTMFRELGMLGKTDIFPTACRRGTILCHTGAEAEGLNILHQIDEYVKKNEPHPTQNRVTVQTALWDAYKTLGDFETAKIYKKKLEESLAALQHRMQNKP